MKAPSTLSIPWALNWIIFCFTFFSFIWLLMTCLTEPISSKLRISRLLDGYDNVLIDFGVFGGCAEAFLAGGSRNITGIDCSSHALGYSVVNTVPLDIADPDGPSASFQFLGRDDTYPMVLVPIATGFTGYSCILLLIAWWGGGKRWARALDMSNMGFHWACTIITWVAFGFCIRLTHILRDRFNGFENGGGNGQDPAPQVRFGNAVWLALVSAILMLIASILYTVRHLWAPAMTEATYAKKNRDLDMEGKRSPKQQPYVGMLAS